MLAKADQQAGCFLAPNAQVWKSMPGRHAMFGGMLETEMTQVCAEVPPSLRGTRQARMTMDGVVFSKVSVCCRICPPRGRLPQFQNKQPMIPTCSAPVPNNKKKGRPAKCMLFRALFVSICMVPCFVLGY